MARKKQFFREATKGDIKKKEFVEVRRFVDVAHLNLNQFTVFPDFLPQGYESYRKFMRHGPEVKLKRFSSLDEAVRLAKPPVKYREEAFDAVDDFFKCGYTYLPLLPIWQRHLLRGRGQLEGIRIDDRKRRVSLVECMEGVRIYAYVHQTGNVIRIKPYKDAKRVRIDGAEVLVEVPSRSQRGRGTEGMREPFKLISVPIVDSPEKYAVAQNIASDHSCGSKRFNIRYPYTDDKESSGVFNYCAHEIAGYLQLVDDEYTENNVVPLQMCQFAIPSQEAVDYYLKWGDNVLIRDENIKSKDKLKKPTHFHKEVALWALVNVYKNNRTFYSDKRRDGDLRDYNWSIS